MELFDPRRGDAALRWRGIDRETLREPSRSNCFTILWIRRGSGIFSVDLSEHRFRSPSLLFASPYQTVLLKSTAPLSGARLDFHANFFCIETYHEEVGCNGVLFNDIYGAPVLPVSRERAEEFDQLIGQIRSELQAGGLAHSELLLSWLKVLLIKATRIKLAQTRHRPASRSRAAPEVLTRLTELIEIHYREKHRPADFARLLGISGKALNKIVRTRFAKTLTVLIRERILKHAKWQLLHTRKPVKEIAAELGFDDEFYFSRLFSRATGMAPTAFRDFETAIRGGRNLSM